MQVQASIETVTPKTAEQLLAKNINNRNVKRTRILRYSAALQRGEWQFDCTYVG